MYNLESDINVVLRKYKLLKYSPHDKVLSGEIELLSDSGKYIDIFNVNISIPECFPKCFPKVVETEGKIPRSMSRHVMPHTNTLCFAVPVEEIITCSNGITLLRFIDSVLVPRLAEEYRVNNGEKYQKEYSHDIGGTWEFLMNSFAITDTDVVLKFIGALANKKTPKGNSLCLCKSDKPYRLCHKKHVENLKHLGNKRLRDLHDELLKNPYKGVNL